MTSLQTHNPSARITDSDHRIILALGCNIEHEKAMKEALALLDDHVRICCKSRLLWTAPIGIVSDNFLNCIVSATTSLSLETLRYKLKEIERRCGRLPDDQSKGIVRMDIDILQFDEQKLKAEDWDRDYIKCLLEDIGYRGCNK